MATPKFALNEITAAQNDAYLTVNESIRALEAVIQGVVIDNATTAPPGSPSEGDCYIIAATATGAWAGREDDIAIYTNGAWAYLTPAEGWKMYDAADNETLLYNGSAWAAETYSVDLAGSGAIYDFGFAKAATPTSSEVIGYVVTPRAITVPADMSGSYGSVGTNPTASFAIDVQDDGVSIGTITIGTGGAFTFVTASGTSKSIAAGSLIEFIAPASVDATVAEIVVGIAATVT